MTSLSEHEALRLGSAEPLQEEGEEEEVTSHRVALPGEAQTASRTSASRDMEALQCRSLVEQLAPLLRLSTISEIPGAGMSVVRMLFPPAHLESYYSILSCNKQSQAPLYCWALRCWRLRVTQRGCLPATGTWCSRRRRKQMAARAKRRCSKRPGGAGPCSRFGHAAVNLWAVRESSFGLATFLLPHKEGEFCCSWDCDRPVHLPSVRSR